MFERIAQQLGICSGLFMQVNVIARFVVPCLKDDDFDCLFRIDFPTEYPWIPNWKDIEAKREQERKLAKEQELEAEAKASESEAREKEIRAFSVIEAKMRR